MIRSKYVHECAICERSIASLCKVLWTCKTNKEKENADSFPFPYSYFVLLKVGNL